MVRTWYHIDATNQILGRMAVKIARILMGKESPEYTPSVDMGHFVVVTGAKKVRLTGNKEGKKIYRYHLGWIGHMVETPVSKMRQQKPEKIVELAVRRMLPKNKLGRAMLKRLKVYGGDEHSHAAQSPVTIKVPSKKGQWFLSEVTDG